MKKTALILALIVVLADCFQCRAQTGIDRDLLNEIYKIKAIDNHAHPFKVVAEGEKPDDEYDALPLEGLEPFALPLRLRPENTEYAAAWRQLFAYRHADLAAAHLKEGLALKQRVAREHGDGYP